MDYMKRYLLGVVAVTMMVGGCDKAVDKDCSAVTAVAPTNEVSDLQAYISAKGITAVADTRGFFYTISRAGSTVHPTVCNTVKVNYQAFLSNGTQFDGANNKSFGLSGLIDGWKEGIPLIGEGGTITLYLPPTLGYGVTGSGPVPGNAITIFQIDLLTVQ
jgi:FKBP-type peptidyl-prolyl cis-trans isomerase FkpA